MACRRWRGFCCGVLAEGADSDEAFVTEGANNDDAFVAEGANFVKDYDFVLRSFERRFVKGVGRMTGAADRLSLWA